MGTKTRFGSIGIAAAALVVGGCSSPPPPKPPGPPVDEPTVKPIETAAEIPREPVETGKPCAKAEAQCGNGVCAVAMNNGCDQAVTCDVTVMMVCQAETDLVQAKARRHETFAAGSKESVSVAADCAAGRIVSTKVQSMVCK